MSVASFEKDYLDYFKNESDTLPENHFAALHTLFLDVDAYCADNELLGEYDINEKQLFESARRCLEIIQRAQDSHV